MDLHEYYMQYINLPKNKDTGLEYTTYLKTFFLFDYSQSFKDAPYKQYVPPLPALASQNQMSNLHTRYLVNLLNYLDSFMDRALPLIDKEAHFVKLQDEFEALWKDKGVNFSWSTAEEDAEVKRFEDETKVVKSTNLDSIDGIDDAPPAALTNQVMHLLFFETTTRTRADSPLIQ